MTCGDPDLGGVGDDVFRLPSQTLTVTVTRRSLQLGTLLLVKRKVKRRRKKTPEEKAEEKAEKEDKDEDKDKKEGDEDEEETDWGKEFGGHEKIGSVSVEEEETLNLAPDADVLPLCEDLNEGQVHMGESCWSTCHGQCPNDVLAQGEGLAFDFDEFAVGHPGCTSHFECVGNHDRQLCHAVQAIEQAGFSSPLVLVGAACLPQVPPSMLRQNPADSAKDESNPAAGLARRTSGCSSSRQTRWARRCGSHRAREFL